MTATASMPVVPVLLYHAVTADPRRHIAPFSVTRTSSGGTWTSSADRGYGTGPSFRAGHLEAEPG